MLLNRFLICFLLTVLPISLYAATYTVAKDGSGNFTSIQEAINSAGINDEVLILDNGVYEEQVTIDSTRNGLTLRSTEPLSREKPAIRFRDTIDIGPTTAEEALNEEMITFDRNGALQILGAKRILIEGIAVDAGGVYPFGGDGIWEGKFPLQHGNGAITLLMAGDVIVRYCDIRAAYFGIYVKDRNEGGIYANWNPADIGTDWVVPFSGALQTGNHLIEYNRIHDNSFGLFFESTWDMGSTIRYNLIFENHHPDDSIVKEVKGLSSEGNQQTGGAFILKDHVLSPLAIYNNTFWHNALMISGNWKTAPIHLIFNNIFAEPVEYWGTSNLIPSTYTECAHIYENRMHCCVMAAQMQKPTTSDVRITNDIRPSLTDSRYTEGTLLQPFAANGNVRWVETPFLSTDPEDELFLEPDWGDENVREYIVDKGWAEAGVKDPDGSAADLGALPEGAGRWSDVVTVRPTMPICLDGTTATIGFAVTPRIGSIENLSVKMFGIVNTEYDTVTIGSVFGPDDDLLVSTGSISRLDMGSYTVQPGNNRTQVTFPAGTGGFAFLELVVEGTGSDGRAVTSAVGFLPYGKMDKYLVVTMLDSNDEEVTEVTPGEPVTVHIAAFNSDGTSFENRVEPTSITLLSNNPLRNSDGEEVTEISGGIEGGTECEIVFTPASSGMDEYVAVSGSWLDDVILIPFLGVSGPIRISPDPSTVRKPLLSQSEETIPDMFELIDLKGRIVRRISTASSKSFSIRNGFLNTAGAGVYLIRKYSGPTAATVKRCVVTGR